ncbi:hypothetical protein [Photobacterium leiognathi]|uniref:hypothetical protein n=1 Tax=Photobacterium leiognathi TaxID=553611 RepID=UPI003DA1B549
MNNYPNYHLPPRFACSFAPNIEVFLFTRFAQALGTCSAIVIWKAVVVSRYERKTSKHGFATIMP